jgi:nitronate monooxygenase
MSFKAPNSIIISGKEVLPIIEGGKGISVTCGKTSGAFANANAVGTFSGVNGDFYDDQGNIIPIIYKGKTRREKHKELIANSIKGGITQAKISHDLSNGNGRIHMNILWEMGGAEPILDAILENTKGLVHGVTCGAGMPYKLSEIAAKYNVYYHPIVSSMRALRALWKRSYSKTANLLGSVVYEDPWLAGGHNGLSNAENPNMPQDPYPRVLEIRKFMNEVGLNNVPIVMAGGVWHLSEWQDWIDNKEIGPIAFQFGTRPILTQESTVSAEWKKKLLELKKGDVFLNRFSPTGFYSSAVNNNFIQELRERADHQIAYSTIQTNELDTALAIGARGRNVFVSKESFANAKIWQAQGFDEALRTPDETLIFVTKDKANEIIKDQADCMGCLSGCLFSNWSEHMEGNTTGRRADPRSFCIQKTLQDVIHSNDIENNLMFAGHNGYRFASDPYYQNGFVPTIKELVDRIMTGY